MSNNLFALFELGLVLLLAFGLAIWQLVAVRRSIKRDQEAAASREPPEP